MQKIYTLLLLILTSLSLSAQVIYYEDFTYANGDLIDKGFVLINADGLTANTGLNSVVANLADTLTVHPWTNYINIGGNDVALSTSWYNPAGTSSDWMITPLINLTTNCTLAWRDICFDGDFPDGLEVRIATNGGTTIADFTTVLFSTIADTTWSVRNVDLTAYNGQNVRFAFRNNTNDGFLLAVDSVTVSSTPSVDAAIVDGSFSEYSIVPLSQVQNYQPSATILNTGGSTVTGVTADVVIYDGANTAVYTASMSTTASLASGATTTLNDMGAGFTPSANDFYLAEYIVSINEADVDATNDTIYLGLEVTDSLYARDYVSLIGQNGINGSIGIGAGGEAILGNVFEITNATELISIDAFFSGTMLIGDTINAKLYNFAANSVGSLIATQEKVITAADTPVFYLNYVFNEPLAVGEYFMALEETNTLNNMGVYYSNLIYTDNKIQGNINGGAFQDFDVLTGGQFRIVPMVRANIYNNACSITALASGAQTPCDNATNEYTQEVTITYTNPPTTGQLNVNGQLFAIGTNPQTVTLTGLDSDGNDVNVTAFFTDDNACTFTENALFTAPASCLCPTITVAANSTDVTDCLNPNGSVTFTPSGGQAPYTYVWSPNVSTTASANNLAAGAYDVIVTDANNCTGNGSATVSNSSGFTAFVSLIGNVSCNGGNDGSATITTNGGQAPYTYAWTPNVSTTNVANNLIAGNYSVVVTDANNCTFNVQNIVISEPSALVQSGFSYTDVSCYGGSDGTINVSYSGGSPGYSYTLDAGAPQSNGQFSGLSAGTYTIAVSDINGCNDQFTQTIIEPDSLTLTLGAQDESSPGAGDGSVSVAVSGGIPNYNYLWDDQNASMSASVSNLNTGTYTVVVTDNNGCQKSGSVFVDVGSSIKTIPNANLTVFPNPADKLVTIQWTSINEKLSVNLYNTIGKQLFTKEIDANQNSLTISLNDYVPGVYFIEINSANGKLVQKLTIKR